MPINIFIAHLWSEDIEVACSICPADQLACIFGGHTRIFGHPHHRWGEPVSVQTKTVISFTLLLTIALAYKKNEADCNRNKCKGNARMMSDGYYVMEKSYLPKYNSICWYWITLLIGFNTCIRAWGEVAGTIFDSHSLAVFSTVNWHWIVTLSFWQLYTASTRSGASSEWSPFTPSTIHLREGQGKRKFYL